MCPRDVEFVTVKSMRVCRCRLQCWPTLNNGLVCVCAMAASINSEEQKVAAQPTERCARPDQPKIILTLLCLRSIPNDLLALPLFGVLTIFHACTHLPWICCWINKSIWLSIRISTLFSHPKYCYCRYVSPTALLWYNIRWYVSLSHYRNRFS